MNQIPNVEETYDTREVVVELFELADWRHRMPENTQKAEELLHHQLQKARESERERIIYITKNIKDAFMSPLTERRWLQCIQFTDQPKPEDQSELDQDKALQDNK